ncbi:UNVERIFIED_CONTAM: hypothetical protein Sradi_3638600 [Sesamum radiatum]|uniref:Reverse transcriptase zinc-binding domain-containing protein n=1 Tax=Sesamum radiatum TaxID=300843 RepID=A0AAW2QIA4_SESRA
MFHPPGPKVGWSLLLLGAFKIPRHRFILWFAILEKLATLDKPWLHHLCSSCVLCSTADLESHEHLFFSCPLASNCLCEVQRLVRFHWPNCNWVTVVHWVSRRWRGKHVVNASFRALLASLVYHVWWGANARIFRHTSRTPLDIASVVVNEIRELIISKELPHTVSSRGLYRL